jgi:hypothetical protein
MIETKGLGISGEGKILCLNCAKILYWSSLEMYLMAGGIKQFSDDDRPTYACKGYCAMTASDGSSNPNKPKIRGGWWTPNRRSTSVCWRHLLTSRRT